MELELVLTKCWEVSMIAVDELVKVWEVCVVVFGVAVEMG